MGKTAHVDADNNPTVSETDPAKLLEAALLQMDGIIAEAGGTGTSNAGQSSGPGRAARARALELAHQLATSLQHAVPPPPRPDFTTASAILRWLQQNNNSVALERSTVVSSSSRSPACWKRFPATFSTSSGGSERPLSTASEASERDSASVQSSEEPPPHELSPARGSMSDREFLTDPLDDEEDEDEEGTAGGLVHPAVRSYMYSPMGGDSDSPDEDTVKCNAWPEGTRSSARAVSSDSASSTSSSDSEDDRYDAGNNGDADYRTLTPSRRLDKSTRRDDTFKWMPSGEIVDDDEVKPIEKTVQEYSSASLDRRRKGTGDRSDRDRKSKSSLSSKPPQHPSSVRASPKPRRPPRIDENTPELQRRWNSYEHFRWPMPPEGGWWPPMCWCHGPPPPACYMHDHAWPSHPSLPPTPPRALCKNDAEERVRRLEHDKESLQLQVQVLSEQISAQGEKMADLERALHEARQRLDDAEQRLQKEMLQRSGLETQKLELLSKLSEVRLRAAERGVLERSPPPEPAPVARPAPPRTPPANYGRQIERNTHMYSSLPRAPPDTRVFAEKEEVIPRGSPSPSLREMRARIGSGGTLPVLEGGELTRGGYRATAQARLQRDRPKQPWETIDIREWDCETTCGWLESLGLESYSAAARTWLTAATESKGVFAAATSHTIEKELGIKHPMHKKKIILGITDLLGCHGDPLLTAAGKLDTAWVLRWLEDVGVSGARDAAAEAALDGRGLHRLAHAELHTHLRVHQALHALSVRRGIQVLRDNNFNPDTMLRRAAENEIEDSLCIARWSSHRVMQWLKQIDLAEYAPNLRGAGVHGGLMLLEPRFTAELLAALLNIPANKTLLRRHLTQRFNDLLGRDVIQGKRNAEQTLGYQPLTTTTKYKVPKKSQFTLKRKKSKDELDNSELVCPFTDDCSGDNNTTPTMKVKAAGVASAVSLPRDDERVH